MVRHHHGQCSTSFIQSRIHHDTYQYHHHQPANHQSLRALCCSVTADIINDKREDRLIQSTSTNNNGRDVIERLPLLSVSMTVRKYLANDLLARTFATHTHIRTCCECSSIQQSLCSRQVWITHALPIFPIDYKTAHKGWIVG